LSEISIERLDSQKLVKIARQESVRGCARLAQEKGGKYAVENHYRSGGDPGFFGNNGTGRRRSCGGAAMADAIEEGVGVVRRAVKRGGDVAEELMDDTTQRVKRHPIETIAATLAFGLVAGVFIGLMIKRR
jgi:hypothetical protein